MKAAEQEWPEKARKVLALIQSEVENDVHEFDGRPFDGRTVSEWISNLSAATVILAEILEGVIERSEQ